MSLDIRYLTNGEKTAYRVEDSGADPVTVNYYERREDIPENIRHFAKENEDPIFVGPDMAYILGAWEYFYPDLLECRKPGYEGRRCIAESCKYGKPSFIDCQYLKMTRKKPSI